MLKLLETVRDVRPNFLLIGSHHYVQLSAFDIEASGLRPHDDLGSVVAILPSGAAVPKVCRRKLEKIFPRSVLYMSIYGQTETGGAVIGSIEDCEGLGPIKPGCQMKVPFCIVHDTVKYTFNVEFYPPSNLKCSRTV